MLHYVQQLVANCISGLCLPFGADKLNNPSWLFRAVKLLPNMLLPVWCWDSLLCRLITFYLGSKVNGVVTELKW